MAEFSFKPMKQDAPEQRAAPFQFGRQEQPEAAPSEPEEDIQWSDVPLEMIHNMPHSAKEFGKGMMSIVTDLPGTAKALKNLGAGALSKAGMRDDKESEKTIDALKDYYVNRFGSEKGFRNALAKDPVGMLADASTFISGGAGALRGASTAARVAKFADLAEAASSASNAVNKVADFTNPVNLAMKGIKNVKVPFVGAKQGFGNYVTDNALSLANKVLAPKSGAPLEALENMRAAGKEGNSAAYAQMKGIADPADIVDKAQSAVDKLAQQRSNAYMRSMSGMQASQTPLPYDKIDAAIKQVKSDAMTGSVIDDLPAWNMADKLENKVLDWRTAPTPPGVVMNNIQGFDKLKRSIAIDQALTQDGSTAERAATAIKNAVKETIVDHAPEYEKAMGQYGDASDRLKQLQQTFRLQGSNRPNKASVDQQLRSILLSRKDGQKASLLQQLNEVEPGLSQMVAGHLLQSWTPKGLFASLATLGTGTSVGIGDALIEGLANVAHMGEAGKLLTPAMIAAQAANLATSSPRLAGMANYGAGRVMAGPGGMGAATLPAMTAYEARKNAPPDNKKPVPPPSFPEIRDDEADTFDRMLQIESGGRQFDKDGRPLVSPKGAVGVAQVLPSTAQDVAQSRGEPFDATALHQDPAYNQRIGRAYYDDLRKQFNDPRVAAAAYNAGPGRVREAQEQATKTGRAWDEFLPPETRAYLGKLEDDSDAEPAPRATGGRVVKHAEKAAALIRAAEKAKKFHVKHTAPLLQKSDETITHALKIADANI